MRDPFADPFAAFVMSEWHQPDVETHVRAEELAAVPGQVVCDHPVGHGEETPDGFEPPIVPLNAGPCPACGAAV